MKSFNRIKRLSDVVLNLIEKENLKDVVVADIASDHGYLAELLARNENIKNVIATDISKKCLGKIESLILENNLTKIETKLGDGLDAIDGVDLCVVAGVGGYEIIKMLNYQNITKNGDVKSRFFVLQPSRNERELRQWIISKKYEIIRDFIVESADRFYPVIVIDVLSNSETENNVFNVCFGRDNDENSVEFLHYLNWIVEEYCFLENLSNDDKNKSNEIITKNNMYCLAKKILNKK